jgi:hypothetical protein
VAYPQRFTAQLRSGRYAQARFRAKRQDDHLAERVRLSLSGAKGEARGAVHPVGPF